MTKALILAVFAASVFVGSCFLIVDTNTPIQACGSKLKEIVEKVCDGTYLTAYKKSAPDAESTEPWDYYQHPQLADQSLLPLFGSGNKDYISPYPFRRQRRGIVDECCKEKCTVQDLKKYCGR